MSAESHAISNELLALYYDGELDAESRKQVETHLPACETCQQELAALKALSSALAVDRLSPDALANRSARSAWLELEPRLIDRAAPAPPLLRWLPGIGLLMANVLVQFIAIVSVMVMLAAGRMGWIGQLVDWLDRALSDLLLGWITWLLPAQLDGWGLSLFLVILSAWMAVLYLAWMGWMWLEHHHPAQQIGA